MKGLWVFILLIIFSALFAIYFRNNYYSQTNIKVPAATTSTIEIPTIAPSPSPSPALSKPFTFKMAGDAMFDRLVDARFRGDKIKNIFDNFDNNFFKNADLSLINLEGPISNTNINIDTSPNNLTFNFPPKTAETFNWLGVNAVSLANNHTSNNGQAGLDNTRLTLKDNNVAAIGDPNNFTDAMSVKRFSNGDINVSVIAVNLVAHNFSIENTISNEKSAGNFVIIFPHWGSEYQKKHNTIQESLAHAWIDAGTDIVVGSHPHVVQDIEIYKNKPIFYSLGNFVFDQTFSTETQRGFVLSGEISDEKMDIEIKPVQSVNLQPRFIEGEVRDDIINDLLKNVDKKFMEDAEIVIYNKFLIFFAPTKRALSICVICVK